MDSEELGAIEHDMRGAAAMPWCDNALEARAIVLVAKELDELNNLLRTHILVTRR